MHRGHLPEVVGGGCRSGEKLLWASFSPGSQGGTEGGRWRWPCAGSPGQSGLCTVSPAAAACPALGQVKAGPGEESRMAWPLLSAGRASAACDSEAWFFPLLWSQTGSWLLDAAAHSRLFGDQLFHPPGQHPPRSRSPRSVLSVT